jgi:hypothetical protein
MIANPERMFIFRLARELGMTTSRLLKEADSREIAEWMAFFSLENKEREKKKKPSPTALSAKMKAALKGFDNSGEKSRKSAH